MGLARLDDALKLRVGQQAVADEGSRQMRAIAWLGRSDRGHRRRLHQLGRMSFCAGNLYRLQRVFLVERIGDVAAIDSFPVDRLIGEFDGFGFYRCRRRRSASRRHGARNSGANRAGDCWRGNANQRRQPLRHILRDPAEQCRDIRRDAEGRRKRRRVVGGDFVDHRQALVSMVVPCLA